MDFLKTQLDRFTHLGSFFFVLLSDGMICVNVPKFDVGIPSREKQHNRPVAK